MSPAEIISRIPPHERTEALIAFVAIDAMQFPGLTREDRQLQQLAHYTDLRDKLVAKANASVEQDAAAAPRVRQTHRAVGTGGIYTLRGRDLEALQARARALIRNIDHHRSPSTGRPRQTSAGEHVLEVRYYGM